MNNIGVGDLIVGTGPRGRGAVYVAYRCEQDGTLRWMNVYCGETHDLGEVSIDMILYEFYGYPSVDGVAAQTDDYGDANVREEPDLELDYPDDFTC